MDTRPTGTEAVGRKRMMSQMNTTIMSPAMDIEALKTKKMRMRTCPLNTGTRFTDTPTTALEMRKRRSQSSSATMLQVTNLKATRARKRRTYQMSIKQKSLAITTTGSPRGKMRTTLPSLATKIPAIDNKATEMKRLGTECPLKRLATSPQNTQGSRIEAIWRREILRRKRKWRRKKTTAGRRKMMKVQSRKKKVLTITAWTRKMRKMRRKVMASA